MELYISGQICKPFCRRLQKHLYLAEFSQCGVLHFLLSMVPKQQNHSKWKYKNTYCLLPCIFFHFLFLPENGRQWFGANSRYSSCLRKPLDGAWCSISKQVTRRGSGGVIVGCLVVWTRQILVMPCCDQVRSSIFVAVQTKNPTDL